jgi:hypothetical protein
VPVALRPERGALSSRVAPNHSIPPAGARWTTRRSPGTSASGGCSGPPSRASSPSPASAPRRFVVAARTGHADFLPPPADEEHRVVGGGAAVACVV